jgi:hypothetical protein
MTGTAPIANVACELEGDATSMGLHMAGQLVANVADNIHQAGGAMEAARFYIALILASLHQAQERLGTAATRRIAEHALTFLQSSDPPTTPH